MRLACVGSIFEQGNKLITMNNQGYILRRLSKDTESSKYQYFVNSVNGLDVITFDKNKAKIVLSNDSIIVSGKDWKFIKIK